MISLKVVGCGLKDVGSSTIEEGYAVLFHIG